jgi:membrane protein implicated in regulation of membrane protease activity
LVYLFLSRVLMRSREELNPADYEMVGVLGRVSGAIRSEGIGEILFSRDGARRASAARSDDGTAISHGEEVVVTRYENGIAYVRRWEDLI